MSLRVLYFRKFSFRLRVSGYLNFAICRLTIERGSNIQPIGRFGFVSWDLRRSPGCLSQRHVRSRHLPSLSLCLSLVFRAGEPLSNSLQCSTQRPEIRCRGRPSLLPRTRVCTSSPYQVSPDRRPTIWSSNLACT